MMMLITFAIDFKPSDHDT